MARTRWTAHDVPDQRGRTAVITGANTGIGFETARVLAARGASVVMAVRDADRGKRAAARIAAEVPGADVSVQRLDLGSLASIRSAAEELHASRSGIDLLINNAGVMYTPYGTTADGFELQIGVNHLGHFALTGLLVDLMLPVSGSSRLYRAVFAVVRPLLIQPAHMGALPTLRAATDPAVQGGQYYGPDGLAESRGHPRVVRRPPGRTTRPPSGGSGACRRS